VGLIIDARGRDPMHLPQDPNARAATIRRWWADTDAIPTGESFGKTSEQEIAPDNPDSTSEGEQPQP
jgi:hypothetical protein